MQEENMNGKNLKIRSKNYKKYFYCSLCKKEVDIEKCKHCEFKEYKTGWENHC